MLPLRYSQICLNEAFAASCQTQCTSVAPGAPLEHLALNLVPMLLFSTPHDSLEAAVRLRCIPSMEKLRADSPPPCHHGQHESGAFLALPSALSDRAKVPSFRKLALRERQGGFPADNVVGGKRGRS